jgi:HK97 gp10 family phage protein
MFGKILGGAIRRGIRGGKGKKGRGGKFGGLDITVHLDMDRLEDLEATAGERADRIVEAAARAIEAGAKSAAPVDTGNLRNGIVVEDAGEARRKVGPTADYAPFVELGTRHRAAQPFLKPAFDAEAPKLKQKLKDIANG